MDRQEQVALFHAEMSALIHKYADEFDLPIPAALGVLEDCKFRILLRAYEIPEFRDEEE